MALEAQLRLCFCQAAVFREWRTISSLRDTADLHSLFDLMAVHARHPAGLMRTAFPEHVRASRMAIHADCVLLRDGIVGIFAEPYWNGVLPSACFHMCLTWPVACFASPRLFRAVRIEHHRLSHSGVLEAAILIFVAGNAHFASDVAPRVRFRLRGCCFLLRCRIALVRQQEPRIDTCRQTQQKNEKKRGDEPVFRDALHGIFKCFRIYVDYPPIDP